MRFESLKSISVLILFVYKLMIGSSNNNRGNYPSLQPNSIKISVIKRDLSWVEKQKVECRVDVFVDGKYIY